jgi:hypothetical protein
MPPANVSNQGLKRTLKEALVEALHEQRELLQEVFVEVLEDFAMVEAIRAGKRTRRASRTDVLRALRGRS